MPMKSFETYKMNVPVWILAVLTKSWFFITTMTLIGFLSAFIATALMSSNYRISASLLFKMGREQVPPPVTTRDVFVSGQPRAEDMVSKMQLLEDQTLITEVVDSLGVDYFLRTPKPVTVFQHIKAALRSAARIVKKGVNEVLIFAGLSKRLTPREKVIEGLLKSIEVEQVRRSDVVQLKLLFSDPQAGVQVTNKIIERFMARHLELYRTPNALDFFEAQSKAIKTQLSTLEVERMQILASSSAFGFSDRRKVLVEQQKDIQLQLAGVHSEIARLGLEIPELESSLKLLPDQELSNRVLRRSATAETLELRTADLLARQESRRGAFEKESRPMKESESEISRVRKLKEGIPEWVPHTETYESNSTKRQLHRDLLSKKDSRTGLGGKQKSLRQELLSLGDQLRMTEEAGVRLHRLEREIATLEQSYLLYEKKKEEVRISDAMDLAKISSISILNPASATIQPVKPSKFRIIGIGAAAFLVLAVAVVLSREAYKPSIHTRSSVSNALCAPVLAEIEEI